MKKLKRKKKKNKIVRNIGIVFLLLLLIIFILTISPNYIKDNQTKTCLIMNQEDVTSKLEKEIYIEEETIYLSMQDVKKILDENLYYNEEEKTIITTSDMHVAYLKLDEMEMEVNGVTIFLKSQIKKKGNTIYLPITELATVYNVELHNIKEENTIIIESLNTEKNQANMNKNISVKWKPTIFSKTIDKLKKGDTVTILEKVEKDWIKVMTDKGKIGYVKEKNLKNEYNVRQSMEKETVSATNYKWKEIRVNELDNLENIESRKEQIEKIVEDIMLGEEDGICLDFDSITEYQDKYFRFIVELAPRIREVGKKTMVKNNQIMNEQTILKIVEAVG